MNGIAVRLGVALVAMVSLAVGCGSQDITEPKSSKSGSPSATSWSGAELVAFEQVVPGSEDSDLYVIRPDGRDLRPLGSSGGYPNWSPDGNMLAFLTCLNPPDCTTAVALLDRSTGKIHGFSTPDPALEIHCAVWSPDGSQLACESFGVHDPKRNGVYSIRAADGKGLTRITRSPGGDDIPLAYSRDGSELLLNRTDPSRGEATSQALFIAPISGGQPRRITPWGYADDVADWSPDGRTIVFGKDGFLYRVSPEGRGLTKIHLKTPDGSAEETAFDVGFSPDGQTIIFSVGGSAPGIYTAGLSGGAMKVVTSGDNHHSNWSAASGS